MDYEEQKQLIIDTLKKKEKTKSKWYFSVPAKGGWTKLEKIRRNSIDTLLGELSRMVSFKSLMHLMIVF